MTKARDTANIVGGGFSGTIAGATMEPTGDTAAGDNAAMGFTAAEGLILTGQGSTNDVTIKNDADADVIEIPTGTVNVTMAGTLGVTGVITGGGLVVPDGSINLADLDIDGGTDIGAALVDADLMIVDDGAGGTNRKATMTRLATYMGTKIGGGLEFIATVDAGNTATISFTGFDASKYDSYKFTFANLLPATDGAYLHVLLSVDSGSNYLAASDSYTIRGTQEASAGDSAFITIGNLGTSNVDGGGASGGLEIHGPHLNKRTFIFPTNGLHNKTDESLGHFGLGYNDGGGQTKANTVVNAIRFLFASGNIASGTITMYGIVNS